MEEKKERHRKFALIRVEESCKYNLRPGQRVADIRYNEQTINVYLLGLRIYSYRLAAGDN